MSRDATAVQWLSWVFATQERKKESVACRSFDLSLYLVSRERYWSSRLYVMVLAEALKYNTAFAELYQTARKASWIAAGVQHVHLKPGDISSGSLKWEMHVTSKLMVSIKRKRVHGVKTSIARSFLGGEAGWHRRWMRNRVVGINDKWAN